MGLSQYVLDLRAILGELRSLACCDTRILFLSTVWGHHAGVSGYHPVASGLGPCVPRDARLLPHPLAALCSWLLSDRHFSERLVLWAAVARARPNILLILDGDFQSWAPKGLRRRLGVKVVATFHQPPEALAKLLSEYPAGELDGAICVSRCQIPVVEKAVGRGNCWFVPHGVDTEFFHAGDGAGDKGLVLFVGVHRRDFETLRESARLIRRMMPDAVVRVIAPRDALPNGFESWGIEAHHGVSDEQLVASYQEASVLLLPLLDCTANNSILEAMACGLPIVTTDVGGVRDYVDASCSVLCRLGDAEDHAEGVVRLLRDGSMRESMSAAARQAAARFSWPCVRDQVRQILARVLLP